MLKSKLNKNDLENNLVKTKVGKMEVWQDLLELDVYDDLGSKYKVGELFYKVLELMEKSDKLTQKIIDIYNSQNKTDALIVKSQDLLSVKVSQLESEVEDLKKKTKYLK